MPNVTIENTVNMLLEFGLRLSSGGLRVIKLNAGESIPNAEYPDEIPDNQITDYLRQLARNGSVKITPTETQVITVQFNAATSAFDRDTGDQVIEVVVSTSDGLDTGEEVTVEINDALTGSATEGSDYNYSPNPKTLTIPVGSANGSVHTVTVNLPSSTGPAETVDFELQNPTFAVLGSQITHELTINSNATQTVTVQYTAPSQNLDGSIPFSYNVAVSIITSDGNPLVAPVSVDVRDLLTGTAVNPTDYTMTTPQTLNWSASEADGTVKNATINVAGANSPGVRTVNLDLNNASGATEGAQNTKVINIIESSP